MIAELSPGLILILGGAARAAAAGAAAAAAYMLMLPIVAFAHLLTLAAWRVGPGAVVRSAAGHAARRPAQPAVRLHLSSRRVARRHLRAARARHASSMSPRLIYAGSALGAVFAGDLVTLFIFWEGIAVASVFLIWAARNERAYRAGMRYLDRADRVGRAAAGGRAAALPADRLAGVRRARARFAGRDADLPRLRHQMRVPAAAQLAAGRLSGSDRHRHGVPFRRSRPRSRSTRWRAVLPARKSSCRSAPR